MLPMSFKKKFLKNLLITGGFNYASQLINFLASIITSRLLSPSDFGVSSLITVFAGFISVFSESTISLAVIRSPYQATYYRGMQILSFIIGNFLCILTLLILYPFSLFYQNTIIILPGIAVAFLFILKSFSIVPIAILQKKLQFALAGKIILIANIAGTLSTILFAALGFKYWALILGQYMIAAATLVLIKNKTGYNLYTRSKRAVYKSYLLTKSVIGRLIGFNTINYWARNADNLLVGRYYGILDLGIYNRAYQMLMIPMGLITGIFTSVLYPSLIKYKNEEGDVQKEYYFMLKLISLINIPVALILIAFPYSFVNILWGKNWLAVAKLLPYFGLLIMTQTLTSTIGSVMIMEKKEKAMMYSGWVNAALMIGGIIYGATISLTAIAAFYSLAYIVLVLPVNIFYMMGHTLRYKSDLLGFWLPKLFLSIVIWLGIYYSVTSLVTGGLIFWVIVILWDTQKELSKIAGFITMRASSMFSKHV